MVSTENASLLSLPPEVRELIYGYLIDDDEDIVVTASKTVTGPSHADVVALRQVCSLFRQEVEEHYYKQQQFMFKTSQGLDSWCATRREYVGLMGRVSVHEKAPPALPSAAQYLTNLQELTIHLRHYVSLYEPLPGRPYGINDHWQYEVKGALGFLNPQLLCAWRVPEKILELFPRFRGGVIQHTYGMMLRFLLPDQKMVKAGTWSGYLESINDVDPIDSGRKRWEKVDVNLLTANIDETLLQMREGGCRQDWPKEGAETYKSFDDFVEIGLGRINVDNP